MRYNLDIWILKDICITISSFLGNWWIVAPTPTLHQCGLRSIEMWSSWVKGLGLFKNLAKREVGNLATKILIWCSKRTQKISNFSYQFVTTNFALFFPSYSSMDYIILNFLGSRLCTNSTVDLSFFNHQFVPSILPIYPLKLLFL